MKIELSEDVQKAERLKDRTCKTCLHYAVCAVNKAAVLSLSNIYGTAVDKAPVQADDLAKICKAYIPTGNMIEP